MEIVIIDGQGGGIGRQLVSAVLAKYPNSTITAIGTNSAATGTMLKAGATYAATGENAVIVAARKADVIIGPIGIVIADSLLGEITPAIATAVCQSSAKRILIPVNHCDNLIAGVPDQPIGKLLESAVELIATI